MYYHGEKGEQKRDTRSEHLPYASQGCKPTTTGKDTSYLRNDIETICF